MVNSNKFDYHNQKIYFDRNIKPFKGIWRDVNTYGHPEDTQSVWILEKSMRLSIGYYDGYFYNILCKNKPGCVFELICKKYIIAWTCVETYQIYNAALKYSEIYEKEPELPITFDFLFNMEIIRI